MKAHFFTLFAGLVFLAGSPALRADRLVPSPLRILRLEDGLRFGLIGDCRLRRAATLFVFEGSLEDAEREPVYTEVARILSRHGFLGVVLDAPAHGEDHRAGEPPELEGWRARLDQGEDLVGPFTQKARAVLAYLVKEGCTDPERIVACGTSRGGFLAFHFAAAEPRVKLVAGISPVVDLMALREFRGASRRALAEKLSLIRLAPSLGNRPVWLSVGNHDLRVDTDQTIAFARALVWARTGPGDRDAVIPVELLVCPTKGHTNIDDAHGLLAAWILRQFGMPAAGPACGTGDDEADANPSAPKMHE